MTRANNLRTRSAQAGLSLIELMISITLGLLLLAGLATLFSNSSQSQHEVRRAAAQIETGRYAMDSLTQDLQLAGFVGEYRKITAPTAIPDPCLVTASDVTNTLNLPVFGYAPASLTATPTVSSTCSGTAAWLSANNLKAGSDVLVVSRTDSTIVPIGTATVSGMWYAQVNPVTLALQGGGGTTSCSSDASGAASTITRRCMTPAASDICYNSGTPGANECPGGSPVGYIRKVYVRIYYVSPCNVPASGSTCSTTNTDDGGRSIPTLKRLELTGSGGTTTFQVTPIAEGVEFMKLSWGIDDTPSTANSETGLIGDGAPDRYVLGPTSVSDFSNVVTLRVDLLVRNVEPSVGFVDAKTYKLGSDPASPTNAAFTITPADVDTSYRRHVYASEIRLVNLSSRKENP